MEDIQEDKRNMREVLEEAKKTLSRILEKFKEHEEKIGEPLGNLVEIPGRNGG